MVSTGVKNGINARDLLTLSVDQSVRLPQAKTLKSNQKTGPIEQDSYENRLKIARKRLLTDTPHTPQKVALVLEQSEPRQTGETEALYDARLKSIREKILCDQPKGVNLFPQKQKSHTLNQNVPNTVLALSVEELTNTPMCIPIAYETKPTTILETSGHLDHTEKPDVREAILEFHKNEIGNASIIATEGEIDNALLKKDEPNFVSPEPPELVKTHKRALPFSPETHMLVTFTPRPLPHGIINVPGETAVERSEWVQKDAVDQYLKLQTLAREYEAKRGAIYSSVIHDA